MSWESRDANAVLQALAEGSRRLDGLRGADLDAARREQIGKIRGARASRAPLGVALVVILVIAGVYYFLPADLFGPSSTGAQQFSAGQEVVVSADVTKVRLRESPGHVGKTWTNVRAVVPSGALVTIVGEPTEVDGLQWWKVEWEGQVGWMATKTENGRVIMTERQPA